MFLPTCLIDANKSKNSSIMFYCTISSDLSYAMTNVLATALPPSMSRGALLLLLAATVNLPRAHRHWDEIVAGFGRIQIVAFATRRDQ